MSNLITIRSDKYFNANLLEHGRIAKDFFDKLTDVVFLKNWETYSTYKELFSNEDFVPLSQNERIQYALFGSALSAITPVYMSECPFNKSDLGLDIEKSRRVDLWCLSKNGANGKTINFFIELKKAYYCTSARKSGDLTNRTSDKMRELINQLESIKKEAKPDWPGDGTIYLGILVLHGYRNNNKKSGFDQDDMAAELEKVIDGRKGIQMLMNTWFPPEGSGATSPWNSDICDFISIIGIVLSRKKHPSNQ